MSLSGQDGVDGLGVDRGLGNGVDWGMGSRLE